MAVGCDSTMFPDLVRGVHLLLLGLSLAAVSLCQSAPNGLSGVVSNREARKAASYIEEATVPAGFSATEFSVRISVGADGAVKHVSNPHSLPAPVFDGAAGSTP